MSILSYRDLVVWQEGMAIAKEVYKAKEHFPKQKLYGLVSQIRRCSVSIPSNIAEGHARTSTKEYLHHISFVMGSLAELGTQLILSNELQYLDEIIMNSLLERCETLGRRLRSLTSSLKSRVLQSKET
ncbi:four helix bundle protein [Bythopirellula goksoeyrii]|uniref:Four helix bundle protein n=1 Tax=Bythopirellula goksoeyrii TaxID=1400387 RepID=A0A5B9QEQ9_9BACT|nr:four helix bundle protein [Bythopirellula goksoeyrii]QEG32813.1 hypothetical protein Pr1d_00730 [Bythopirellula goksoeyrii]